ncbi:duf1857 domain containing protein [Grosmannia clavigera kw1407]|uniref:Duf1857 domain containing protein n=1 Tax=Grosmannia clavigera (strain kw1407 / UAMH 11150) TaxID=655863 RepID=F0XAR3_GROCL|nr:duf1857 domain containing protein [Grosmannia clavigera kw1407]EFX05721.1 duf1857 domain containing protein [Grosmannia clavigera kw1407]
MVTIHLAVTVPVNAPGASLVLSQVQVFAGFQRKIRQPQEFAPAIAKAEVLSDVGGVVKRRVTFKAPSAPDTGGHPAEVLETCTELAPSRVDYELDNGSTVLNIVSTGTSGKPEDLYVTYVFAWKHADLEAGSMAAREVQTSHEKIAKVVVESSIATTRRLVSEGKI